MTPTPSSKASNAPVVLLGSTGMLGSDLAVAMHPHLAGRTLFTPGRAECDITNEKSVLAYLTKVKPGSLINWRGRWRWHGRGR